MQTGHVVHSAAFAVPSKSVSSTGYKLPSSLVAMLLGMATLIPLIKYERVGNEEMSLVLIVNAAHAECP